MSNAMIPLIAPSISQWEQAGASLANALSKYLDMCTSLGTNSMKEGTHPNTLVERIECQLQSLHTTMDQQLAQTRKILSKTRNEIVSSIYHLPEEIIAEISTYFVYSPSLDMELREVVVAIDRRLFEIYQRVYTLLQVCTRWNKVILGRGYFWSLIPVIQTPISYVDCMNRKFQDLAMKREKAMSLSLERAQGCRLDIVVVPEEWTFHDEYLNELKGYLPQIRSMNIRSTEIDGILCLINGIIELQGLTGPGSSLSSLLELSIYQEQNRNIFRRLLRPSEYLYSPESPELQVPFNKLIQSLPVLRINGAHIHWDTLVFSKQLTRLRLQAINFGTDLTMVSCLHHALASATGLHELELVSVKSFYEEDQTAPFLTTTKHPISLPNLESLLVDDLCFNTMLFLFGSIVSRSHRLTLHLTGNSRFFNFPGEPEERFAGSIGFLKQMLQQIPVHRLFIHEDYSPSEEVLKGTIESLPMLDTLIMHHANFTTERCQALTRPEAQGNELGLPSFPSFQDLFFSHARIDDMLAFKNMLSSHTQSLRQLTLGGRVCDQTSSLRGSGSGPSHRTGVNKDRDNDMIAQFKEIVPAAGFRLVDSDYVPLWFQDTAHVWQLW